SLTKRACRPGSGLGALASRTLSISRPATARAAWYPGTFSKMDIVLPFVGCSARFERKSNENAGDDAIARRSLIVPKRTQHVGHDRKRAPQRQPKQADRDVRLRPPHQIINRANAPPVEPPTPAARRTDVALAKLQPGQEKRRHTQRISPADRL